MQWLGSFLFELPARRLVVAMVFLSQLFAVPVFSEPPKNTGGGLPAGLDLAKVQAHKQITVGDFFNEALDKQKHEGDLDKEVKTFIKHAQLLGTFPNNPEFSEWWEANRARYLRPAMLKKMKGLTLAEYATKLFLLFTAEEAMAIDAADPENVKKRDRGELTDGDKHVAGTVLGMDLNTGTIVLLGAVGGFIGAVGKKLLDVFFHGPVAQIMNTALEPIIRPVRERIDVWINKHLAPRTVWWAMLVAGEWRNRRKAVANAEQGREQKGDAKRYDHPAIATKDFADDTEQFFREMLKADYKWRGWTLPEFARARTTGFELLFHQYRLLGEQLTGYQTGRAVNNTMQATVNRPALMAAGASETDINEFARLIVFRHQLMVYRDLHHPEVLGTEAAMHAIMDKWTRGGILPATIEAFAETEKQTQILHDRSAFLLASVLDGERYFQENNLALAEYPMIQAWQEQAREMTGYYQELETNQERIQKYFDRRGLKYDVKKRVAERGYPLGGPRRPETQAPVADCVKTYFQKLAQKSIEPRVSP